MLTKEEIDNLDRAEILIYNVTQLMEERGEDKANINKIQDIILLMNNSIADIG